MNKNKTRRSLGTFGGKRTDSSMSSSSNSSVPGLRNDLCRSSNNSSSSSSSSSSGSASPGCTATARRCYCQAQLYNTSPGFVGAAASIDTRSVVLRCEPNSTFGATSSAWVGIGTVTGTEPNTNHFSGEIGYIRLRKGGSTGVQVGIFFEIIYNNAWQAWKVGPAPSGNGVPYSIVLDPSTGTWSAYYQNNLWQTYNSHVWADWSAQLATWAGEINFYENTMVGNDSHLGPPGPCNFTNCQYKLSGGSGFVAAGLTSSDLGTTDGAQWVPTYGNGTSFSIYDTLGRPHS